MMAIEFEDNGMSSDGDGCLVAATLSGDNRAFGSLYDRYARLIKATCYDATWDISQAEDLCQEVFLEAFSQLDRLRKPHRFAAWVMGIARHKCRNWIRRHAREVHRRKKIDLFSISQLSEPDLDMTDDLTFLHSKLLELPEKERLAIQMCYLCEDSHERARSVLGLSRSGLYAVLRRARQRLRRLMSAYCKEPPHE